jgi:hypothetical protein
VQEAEPVGMKRRSALQRTALSLLVVLGAYAAVWGYFQWKALKVRAELARKLQPLLKEGDALGELPDTDLDPKSLSLAELKEKFHDPGQRTDGARNTTKIGWLCGGNSCAVWASFLVPFGQEVPLTTAPVALLVNTPYLQLPHHLAIGGIYLCETDEDVKKFCQMHGRELVAGKNRINWDKDWSATWAERDGKISLILFANEKAIKDAKLDAGGNGVDAVDSNKGSAK